MRHFLILLFFVMNTPWIIAQDTINKLDNHGKKHGYWIKKDSAGSKVYEGRFTHGIPVGEFRYYYKNGALKTKSVVSRNGTHAATVSWFQNGKKMAAGNYLNEKKDSLWQFYSDLMDTKTSEEFYRNGKLNGVAKVFYPSGPLAELKTYVDGTLEGKWEKYFEDGRIQLKGNYHLGEKHGVIIIYSPDNQVLVKGKYVNGHQDGEWIYNEAGKGKKREIYKMGILIKSIEAPE
jgi:antitoxin component YwqK of YwqJK toxin-antitoxin module